MERMVNLTNMRWKLARMQRRKEKAMSSLKRWWTSNISKFIN